MAAFKEKIDPKMSIPIPLDLQRGSWVFLVVGLLLDLSVDNAKGKVYYHHQKGQQGQFDQHGSGGQTAGPGTAPYGGSRGEPLDLVLFLKDDPGPKEADSGDHLSQDPGGIGLRRSHEPQGYQYIGTGTQGHKGIGLQPGTLPLVLAFQADEGPSQGGQSQLDAKFHDRCQVKSEQFFHLPVVFKKAPQKHRGAIVVQLIK